MGTMLCMYNDLCGYVKIDLNKLHAKNNQAESPKPISKLKMPDGQADKVED